MPYAAALLLVAAAAGVQRGDLPEERHPTGDGAFAAVRIGRWQAQAETLAVEDRGRPPHIRDIICSASNPDARLMMHSDGQLDLDFAHEGDEAPGYGVLNIDRITIGGRSFDTRSRHRPLFYGSKFSNVDYGEPADPIRTVPFIGYLSVRLPGGHWAPLSAVLSEMLRVDRVTIRYRGDTDQAGKSAIREQATADVTGLGQVLRWCQAAITSEAAYRYRGQ